MIDPKSRFLLCNITQYGDISTARVLDWDQRRQYVVVGPESLFPEGEDVEIDILKHYLGHLSPAVHTIRLDDQGRLLSISSAPEDDEGLALHYPNYFDVPSLQTCATVELSKLLELDRFGPGVDMVNYVTNPGASKKAVFKYYLIPQWKDHIWNEMHILKDLPRHPNLVEFDKIVVTNQSEVVGFTTTYIPGENFEKNKNEIFRLKWLHQLTHVINLLNLNLGIEHQDVAPRNILLNPSPSESEPANDSIRLIDFDSAAWTGTSGDVPERDDIQGVVFTIYEIITNDYSYRETHPPPWNIEAIMDLDEWPKKRPLDNGVARFRSHLRDWLQQRSSYPNRMQVAELSRQSPPVAKIPAIPQPRPVLTGYDDDGTAIYKSQMVQIRRVAAKVGQSLVPWQRPAYDDAHSHVDSQRETTTT